METSDYGACWAVVKRARVVLLASEGSATTQIAELADASVVMVLKWRSRYEEAGIAGLGR